MEQLRQQYRKILLVCMALGFALTGLGFCVDLFGMQAALIKAPYGAIVAVLLASVCGAALACLSFGFALIEQGMAEQALLRADAKCRNCIAALEGQNPWAAARLRDDYRRVKAVAAIKRP